MNKYASSATMLALAFLLAGWPRPAVSAPTPPARDGADAPALPKSLKARQAITEYDRTVREAERVFEKAKADADAKRRQALKVAMDEALANKNLDVANKIKLAMGDRTATAASKEGASLIGTVFHRFGVGDHPKDAEIKLLPNGKLEGVRTGYSLWKGEGDTLLLSKGDGKPPARYVHRKDVPVFYATDSSSSSWGVLVAVPGGPVQDEQRR